MILESNQEIDNHLWMYSFIKNRHLSSQIHMKTMVNIPHTI
jgi:hypothetical protein